MVLGIAERVAANRAAACPAAPYAYGPGKPDDLCHACHFWSNHPGGAHFLFADGSVRFMAYGASAMLPALATRAGSEPTAGP